MESLEAKTQQLKATFQDFANNVIESELIKAILDLANNALNILNTEVGQTITQWVLLAGTLTGAVAIFGTIGGKIALSTIKFYQVIKGTSSLISIMQNLASVFGLAATSGTTLAASLGSLFSIAFPIAGIIAGIGVAAYTLYKIWKDNNPTLDETNEKINDLNLELERNLELLEELKNTPWHKRTLGIEDEIEDIEKENEVLQENIDKWENKKNNILKEQTFENRYVPISGYQFVQGDIVRGQGRTVEEAIENTLTTGLSNYNLDPTVESLERFGFALKENIYYIEATEEESNKLYTQLMNKLSLSLGELYKDGLNDVEALNQLGAQINEVKSQIEPIVQTYIQLHDSTGQLTDDQTLLVESFYRLDGVFDDISKLTDLQKDWNDSVSLTQDEYLKLTYLVPQLNDLILNTGDNFEIDANKLIELMLANEEWASSAILNQESLTDIAYTETNKRIKYYEEELKVLEYFKNSAFSFLISPDYINNVSDKLDQLKNWFDKLTNKKQENLVFGGIPSDEKDYIEEQNELFKKQLDLLKNKLEILESSNASQSELVSQLDLIQKEIKSQIDWYHAQGLNDESEYISELIALWWDYENQIVDIKANAYETLFNFMGNKIDSEIQKLQDQRTEEENYWDKKINALQEENEELDRQIQLEKLQDNLLKARQKRNLVYKDGKFQYIEDVDAVSESLANLETYQREESLRQEVENLQTLKQQAIDSIDEQIKNWERYKEEWTSVVQNYQEEQEKLLIEQEFGIDIENENWKKRINNLEDYVEQYEKLMKRISSSSSSSFSSTSGSPVSSGASGGQYTDNDEIISKVENISSSSQTSISSSPNKDKNSLGGIIKDGIDFVGDVVTSIGQGIGSIVGNIGHTLGFYETGTLSSKKGLALVGENGPELRVFNQGEGVIPSNITSNLWSWGTYNPNDLISKFNLLSSAEPSNIITIENFSPVLSNVHNGEEFANYIKDNFVRQVIQYK